MKRFGNAYTANTGAAGLTERARLQAASRQVRQGQPLNELSDMSAINAVAGQIFCCPPVVVPPVPPGPLPCSYRDLWQNQQKTSLISDMTVDTQDRVIVTGGWDTNPCVLYDSSSVAWSSLTGFGGNVTGATFLSVVDAHGQAVWSAKQLALSSIPPPFGSTTFIPCNAVSADSSRRIVVAFAFNNDLVVPSFRAYNTGGVTFRSPLVNGKYNWAVVQYSAGGAVNWIGNTVFSGFDLPTTRSSFVQYSMTGDSDSVYLYGSVEGGAGLSVTAYGAFGGSRTGTLPSSPCVILQKYSSSGVLHWMRFIQASPVSFLGRAESMFQRVDGRILVCVTKQLPGVATTDIVFYQKGDLTYDSITYPTFNGTASTVYIQYTSDGDPEWAVAVSNQASRNNYPARPVGLRCQPVALDASGYYTIGTIDRGTGATTFQDADGVIRNSFVGSAGQRGAYVARLSPSGNYQWICPIGYSEMNVNGVVCTDSGIYVTGTDESSAMFTISFYDAAGVPQVTIPGNCIFVAKYSHAGAVLWVRYARPSGILTSSPIRLETDSDGNVYQYFSSGNSVTWFTVAGGVERTITQPGVTGSYLVKYAPDGAILWIGYAGQNRSLEAIACKRTSCDEIVTQSTCWTTVDPCVVTDAEEVPRFTLPLVGILNGLTVFWPGRGY